MTAPDLLERTRMALAEAGYPNALVSLDADGVLWTRTTQVPTDVSWRAKSLARAAENGATPCFACLFSGDRDRTTLPQRIAACLADRPLVRDCGVTR